MDLTLEAFTNREECAMGWIRDWRERHARHTAHYWARTNGQEVVPDDCSCTGCLDAAEASAVSWWSE